LVEDAHDHAIIMLDPQGNVMRWNAGAERLQGYPAREIVGKHYSHFYPADEIAEGRPAQELEIAASEGRCETEGWQVRKDGSRFWSSMVFTALRDGAGHLRGFSQVIRDIEERRLVEEERSRAEAIQQNLRMALEHERDIVQTLAEGYLRKTPEIPGFDVAYFFQPASRKDRVGGDCFDFFPVGSGRYGVFIGDVCGKGLSAAVYASKAKHTLRAYALEDPEPESVLSRLNRALCSETDEEGKFVTLIYGMLDSRSGTFTYANAGHPLPLLYDPISNACERLEATGGLVGAIIDMEFKQKTIPLSQGTVLVFFTDGVVEATGCVDPYGDGGISAMLIDNGGGNAEVLARRIFDRSRKMAAQHREDDMAVITVRYEGVMEKAYAYSAGTLVLNKRLLSR